MARPFFLPEARQKVKKPEKYTWMVPAIVAVASLIVIAAFVYLLATGLLFTSPTAKH